jgi:hypothetical protein
LSICDSAWRSRERQLQFALAHVLDFLRHVLPVELGAVDALAGG